MLVGLSIFAYNILHAETAVESEECVSRKTGSPERETAVESEECASQIDFSFTT